jgi:hypothetical protein
MAFISITRLRVRSIRYLPQFLWFTFLSYRQAKRSSGYLAVKILRDAGSTYWTSTAWTDEAAMRAYISSGAHRRVMPKLKDWCDEAYITHWEQESVELPAWQEAHQRITESGRRSKVNNPSPAYLAFEVPKPKA